MFKGRLPPTLENKVMTASKKVKLLHSHHKPCALYKVDLSCFLHLRTVTLMRVEQTRVRPFVAHGPSLIPLPSPVEGGPAQRRDLFKIKNVFCHGPEWLKEVCYTQTVRTTTYVNTQITT